MCNWRFRVQSDSVRNKISPYFCTLHENCSKSVVPKSIYICTTQSSQVFCRQRSRLTRIVPTVRKSGWISSLIISYEYWPISANLNDSTQRMSIITPFLFFSALFLVGRYNNKPWKIALIYRLSEPNLISYKFVLVIVLNFVQRTKRSWNIYYCFCLRKWKTRC